MSADGLAEKLYIAYAGVVLPWTPPFAELGADDRAGWEAGAVTARTEVMRLMAGNFQALLNMTVDDPEAAPYRAGVQYMIDILRRVVAESGPDAIAKVLS